VPCGQPRGGQRRLQRDPAAHDHLFLGAHAA
jgi:hypothetical protein